MYEDYKAKLIIINNNKNKYNNYKKYKIIKAPVIFISNLNRQRAKIIINLTLQKALLIEKI